MNLALKKVFEAEYEQYDGYLLVKFKHLKSYKQVNLYMQANKNWLKFNEFNLL